MAVRKSRLRKFLNSEQERLYLYFARGHTYSGKTIDEIPATQVGKEQFMMWCSDNIHPTNPDDYYLVLKNGRTWFFYQQEELRQHYGTEEWPGWESLRDDWKDNLWILDKLTSWYNKQ